MKKIVFPILLLILISSCRKEEFQDEECDNAQINLCNNSTNGIFIYGWGTNQATDTLFPGECELKDMGYFSVKYDFWGNLDETSNSAITLYSPHAGSYLLDVTSCYWEYNPTSYINISHCYNGIFDPQEQEHDTDCGGNCAPCPELVIPCNSPLVHDRFSFGGANYSLSSSFEAGTVDNDRWMRFTMYNGETFNFTIPTNENPFTSKRLIVGNEYWETSAWFTDRSGLFRYDALHGQSIYFMVDSAGSESVKFCDIDFKRNNQVLVGSGSLSLD